MCKNVALIVRANGDRVTYIFDGPHSFIDVDNAMYRLEQQDARVIFNNEVHQMCKLYDIELTHTAHVDTSILWRYIASKGTYVSGYIHFA